MENLSNQKIFIFHFFKMKTWEGCATKHIKQINFTKIYHTEVNKLSYPHPRQQQQEQQEESKPYCTKNLYL